MEILNLNDKDNKLFYIGGVVRDEILNAESFDVDLTYEGNAIEFAKNIKGLKILKVNEPFGTVRVLIKNKEVDIASTRAEKYEKAGHLPTVTKIGCSLKEDVLRRDFTINALAKNVHTGEIIDFTGGLSDIKNKTITEEMLKKDQNNRIKYNTNLIKLYINFPKLLIKRKKFFFIIHFIHNYFPLS